MLDNLSAHKGPEVREWLAKPRQKRWHLHFTPTSSSWLNLVEGWFAQLTNKRLRTGSFNSVAAHTEAIDHWVSYWNDDPKPSAWTKTANEIMVSSLREFVEASRSEIKDVVSRHGGRAVALFGSAARGDEGPASDLDFLVDLIPGSSLFDLVRLQDELRNLLGLPVDVVSLGALLPRDDDVRRDAIWL